MPRTPLRTRSALVRGVSARARRAACGWPGCSGRPASPSPAAPDAEMEVTSTAYALPGAVSAEPGRRRRGRPGRAGPARAGGATVGTTARFAVATGSGLRDRTARRARDHHDQHRGLDLRGRRRHDRGRRHHRRRAGRLPAPASGDRGGLLGGDRRCSWSASCSTFLPGHAARRCSARATAGSHRPTRPVVQLLPVGMLSGLAAGLIAYAMLRRARRAGPTWPGPGTPWPAPARACCW